MENTIGVDELHLEGRKECVGPRHSAIIHNTRRDTTLEPSNSRVYSALKEPRLHVIELCVGKISTNYRTLLSEEQHRTRTPITL